MKINRIAASVAATAALAAPLAVTAPAEAYAGTPGCVTLTEYRSITNGMTQTQVARRFGTYSSPYWGTITYSYDSDTWQEIDREWRICNSAGKPKPLYMGSVEVWFEREADWDTGYMSGPLLSTHKSRWAS